MYRKILGTEHLENMQRIADASSYIYSPEWLYTCETATKIQTAINQIEFPTSEVIQQIQYMANAINHMFAPYQESRANIENSVLAFSDVINSIKVPILSLYQDDVSSDEEAEINETNERIISEIFTPNEEKKIHIDDSPIITLSPVNDRVLKYLAENPEELYRLSGNEFENVMAEIYAKLGYDVTRTQATRDGGKDIIIRKPEVIGDFIYYVECKKHRAGRPVGVGIVKNLVGTVSTDRVNGGILATTSFFTRDARKLILDNKLNCQIQLHDYNKVQELLNIVTK